jgi:hypothetical protein
MGQPLVVLRTTGRLQTEARICAAGHLANDLTLIDVAQSLVRVGQLREWMVPGLLDAAVAEWENRIQAFRVEYDFIESQNAPQEAQAQPQGENPLVLVTKTRPA